MPSSWVFDQRGNVPIFSHPAFCPLRSLVLWDAQGLRWGIFSAHRMTAFPLVHLDPVSFSSFFFLKLISLFYFWLHWVFVAAQSFSSCSERGLLLSCGAWASHCGGFSCCRAQALGTQTSVVAVCWLSCSVASCSIVLNLLVLNLKMFKLWWNTVEEIH